LGYLWILFKEHVVGGFAGAVIPDDGRAFLVVIHVTAFGLERHSLKVADFVTDDPGPTFSKYAPLEGRIDVTCAGTRTPGLGVDSAERDFTVDVGNQFRLLVNHEKIKDTKNGTLAIDSQRSGKVPERIAVFEKRQGNVSRAEYQHAFHDPE
jgi:hypothetical protein